LSNTNVAVLKINLTLPYPDIQKSCIRQSG
jgi:hypothetical protein